MKNRHLLILCCLLMAAMPYKAMAQQPYPVDTVDGTAVYRYTPEKSIGLYRISVRFGVPQDVIIQWNPQLKERGPQLGETLLIPVKQGKKDIAVQTQTAADTAKAAAPMPQKKEAIEELSPVTQQPSDSVIIADNAPKEERTAAETDTTGASVQVAEQVAADAITQEPLADGFITTEDGRVLRIGVFLPLRADVAERDASVDRFFDFYAGVLLAVKESESTGQQIELRLYDTDKGFRKIDQFRADPFLHTVDAIIGPVYPAQVEYMSESVQRDSVLMFVPFADNIPSIATNPFIFQFNPTPAIEAEKMADYITSKENATNCIVAESKDEQIPQSIQLLHEALEAKSARTSRISLREILNDSIDTVLEDTMENILIFGTEKYGNLQVLMPHIVSAKQTNVITLFSHYSWERESIPLCQLYTSVFANSDDGRNVMELYAESWRQYFGYTPSVTHPRYDLLGYDITTQLIFTLQRLQDIADPAYREMILTRPFHGLQSDIQYMRVTETGGYINNAISIQAR